MVNYLHKKKNSAQGKGTPHRLNSRSELYTHEIYTNILYIVKSVDAPTKANSCTKC